jgi:hypothetical protein
MDTKEDMRCVRIEVVPWLSYRMAGTEDPMDVYVSVEGSLTLTGVLTRLCSEHPKLASIVLVPGRLVITPQVVLLVNHRAFELAGGYEMTIEPGDTLTFVPAYQGG